MPAIKISLVGEGGVGKTTLVRLLEKQCMDATRKPTIGVDVSVAKLGEDKLAVWDLAGQRRFQLMWDDFLKGSQVTLVVTDSSPKNVMLTKDIIERHLNNSASKIIAIANKQDMKGSMSPEEIQAALGVPTYGMVATDRQNEEILREIISTQLPKQ
jgi:small GTP-binding protein